MKKLGRPIKYFDKRGQIWCRATKAEKLMIKIAADIIGTTTAQFILDSAIKCADKIIQKKETVMFIDDSLMESFKSPKEMAKEENAFECCTCKQWYKEWQLYENADGFFCKRCWQGKFFNNQSYVGKFITSDNMPVDFFIKVHNVTNQYFYGFDRHNIPHIINILDHRINEASFNMCEDCHIELPIKAIKYFNEIKLCDSCYQSHDDLDPIYT